MEYEELKEYLIDSVTDSLDLKYPPFEIEDENDSSLKTVLSMYKNLMNVYTSLIIGKEKIGR